MKPYTLVLPVGQPIDLAVVGDYVRLKGALVPVVVRCEETGESVELEPGDDARLTRFTRISVMHASGTQQSIVLYVGNGTSAGSSKVGGSVSVSGDVSNVPKAGTIYGKSVATVGTSSTQVRNVDELRRYWFMQNVGATTIYVQINGTAVIGNGIKLLPNDSFVFDAYVPTDTFYAISDAAGGLLSWIEGR